MKNKKAIAVIMLMLTLLFAFSSTALASGSSGVSEAIEGTWDEASGEIRTVVDNVVFPAIDMILAIFFFAKLSMSYFDYKKHGQFEWSATRF